MSTYQSVQSATSEDASVVITKPTGLAVGDLMVAGIWYDNDATGSSIINTPSGWTLEEGFGISTNSSYIAVFSKVADSSDVAASNFTFATNNADASYHLIGHIVRVTSYGIYTDSSTGSATSSTTATVTGFTPSRANCLLLGFSGVSDTTLRNTSSWALATNDPSWTERVDTSFSDANRRSSLAVYTATRPETTATGNITVTVSGNTSNRVGAIIIAISPQINGSVTPTTKINAYSLTPIQSAQLDAITEDPTTNTYKDTPWTNEAKNTSTWTNESK